MIHTCVRARTGFWFGAAMVWTSVWIVRRQSDS